MPIQLTKKEYGMQEGIGSVSIIVPRTKQFFRNVSTA